MSDLSIRSLNVQTIEKKNNQDLKVVAEKAEITTSKEITPKKDSLNVQTQTGAGIPKQNISFAPQPRSFFTENNVKGLIVITGIMAGAGTMLATRGIKGAAIGMGIMGV